MAFIGLGRPKSASSSHPASKPVSRPPRVVESKNEFQEPFYDYGYLHFTNPLSLNIIFAIIYAIFFNYVILIIQ